MSSIKYTGAADYKAFTEEFSEELFTILFYGFATSRWVTPHEGLKGKKILTELTVGDLIKRWKKTFDPDEDTLGFKPREISTELVKMDLQIFPQEFEQTYLAFARRRGQNKGDLPFEGFIVRALLQKIAKEQENAVWQAVKTANPQDNDPLMDMFDGYLKLIDDAEAAGDLTGIPVVDLSEDNIVLHVEEMFNNLDPAARGEKLSICCSWKNYYRYMAGYRDKFGKYIEKASDRSLKLDIGDVMLRPVNGMGNTDRMIITLDSNYHYAYDAAGDSSFINFENNHRAVDMFLDFRIGVQMQWLEDRGGLIVINDPQTSESSSE